MKPKADMLIFFKDDEDLEYQDMTTYPDQSLYRGQIKKVEQVINGDTVQVTQKCGYGVRQFEDGSSYEGYWSNNMPNG